MVEIAEVSHGGKVVKAVVGVCGGAVLVHAGMADLLLREGVGHVDDDVKTAFHG